MLKTASFNATAPASDVPLWPTSPVTSVQFRFPDAFKWGAACSAFQIEGGAAADGRGPSVWDVAGVERADLFHRRRTPAIAADFYHRYPQDIAMMAELGLKSFRFSISWSRVLPTGRDEINRKGVDFYHRVIDLLHRHGIEPMIDLYHWDLPAALAREGGLLRPTIVEDFTAYAALCFREYGEKVPLWSTLNEPSAIEHYHPFSPANKHPVQRYRIDHHSLQMHFAAVREYRRQACPGQIGAVIAYVPVYPASHSPADRQAADLQQAHITARWLDPMLLGSYPEELIEHEHLAHVLPPDYAQQIARDYEPMDFIGLNYYTPNVVRHDADCFLHGQPAEPFAAQSDYGFTIYPPGLSDALASIQARYGHPVIYITENGIAHDSDKVGPSKLEDPDRIDYLREHLREVCRCIRAGMDIRGYYYWSLLDTFESTSAYRYLFGLVEYDHATLERRRRQSWYYYQHCIAQNAVC